MKPLRRRTFLELSAAGSVLPAVGATAPAAPKAFSAYARVPLGTTGLTPTRLSFGTGIRANTRSSTIGRMGHDYAVGLIRAAYERGIRAFDLADAYGTHPLAAEALAPFPRESYVLFTKIWWRPGSIPDSDRAPVAKLIERFLRELRTDYIDLVQLHCVDNPSWPTELATEMEDLEKAKKAGKIRAHGISVHAFSALHASPDVPWLDAIHVRINPFGRAMEGPVDRNVAELRRLKLAGKGVIGMKLIGEGALAADSAGIDASLSFALNSNLVDVLNIGFVCIEQVDDIAARISRVKVQS